MQRNLDKKISRHKSKKKNIYNGFPKKVGPIQQNNIYIINAAAFCAEMIDPANPVLRKTGENQNSQQKKVLKCKRYALPAPLVW